MVIRRLDHRSLVVGFLFAHRKTKKRDEWRCVIDIWSPCREKPTCQDAQNSTSRSSLRALGRSSGCGRSISNSRITEAWRTAIASSSQITYGGGSSSRRTYESVGLPSHRSRSLPLLLSSNLSTLERNLRSVPNTNDRYEERHCVVIGTKRLNSEAEVTGGGYLANASSISVCSPSAVLTTQGIVPLYLFAVSQYSCLFPGSTHSLSLWTVYRLQPWRPVCIDPSSFLFRKAGFVALCSAIPKCVA